MDKRTCKQCDADISHRSRAAQFCDRLCSGRYSRRHNDKVCTVDGCDNPHGARGLCYSHYGTWHRKHNGRKASEYFTIDCTVCDRAWVTRRKDAKYCSELCYHFDKWGPRFSVWPKPEPKVRIPRPKPQPFREQRQCSWCEATFTATRRDHIYCSSEHKVRAMRNRRRGREHGSTTHYTWAEVMRLYVHRFNKCCAYCEAPVVGQPDPDHVVPLSRGGSNSITNILPSCRSCNSDKRDLFLHEWATDRARRGLPAVTTQWRPGDPRVTHLTDALLISPAA